MGKKKSSGLELLSLFWRHFKLIGPWWFQIIYQPATGNFIRIFPWGTVGCWTAESEYWRYIPKWMKSGWIRCEHLQHHSVLAVLQQESLLCPACKIMESEDTYLLSYLLIHEMVTLPAFKSDEKASSAVFLGM